MATQKQGKGKKSWTASRKASNERGHVRRVRRKEERRTAQLKREKDNRDTRALGGATPWEIARQARAIGRVGRVRRA